MSAFWNNLHRLAQGLLVNGGYLGASFPSETTEVVATRTAPKKERRTEPARHVPNAPVATCR